MAFQLFVQPQEGELIGRGIDKLGQGIGAKIDQMQEERDKWSSNEKAVQSIYKSHPELLEGTGYDPDHTSRHDASRIWEGLVQKTKLGGEVQTQKLQAAQAAEAQSKGDMYGDVITARNNSAAGRLMQALVKQGHKPEDAQKIARETFPDANIGGGTMQSTDTKSIFDQYAPDSPVLKQAIATKQEESKGQIGQMAGLAKYISSLNPAQVQEFQKDASQYSQLAKVLPQQLNAINQVGGINKLRSQGVLPVGNGGITSDPDAMLKSLKSQKAQTYSAMQSLQQKHGNLAAVLASEPSALQDPTSFVNNAANYLKAQQNFQK